MATIEVMNEYEPSIDSVRSKPTIKKKYNNINYKRFKNNSLYNEIVSFSKIVLKYFNSKDLDIFYNNINELEIITNAYSNYYKNCYIPKENKIYLENTDAFLAHELFHLASSICDNDDKTVFSGFAQLNDESSIGVGLNEGYTQLLNERFFTNESNEKCYSDEVLYARLTELIIGEKKMSKLYLTADLKGLIEELCKYANTEEVLRFITRIDNIQACKYINTTSDLNDDMLLILIDSYKGAKRFLLKTYLKKFAEEYKAKRYKILMTPKVMSLINYIYELMEKNIILNTRTGEEIEIISEDEIEKSAGEVFGMERMRLFRQ